MSERRKLTPFLAHEMLFDYVTENLDFDRKRAIEEFIKDDRESQNLIEAIRRGLSYADSLKRIQLKAEIVDELDESESLISLSRRMAHWSNWPDSLRWSLIALMISICTAGIVVLIPWTSVSYFSFLRPGQSLDSGTVEIARVDGRKLPEGAAVIAANEEENEDQQSGPLEGSGDEEFAEESSGAIPPRPVASPPAVAVAAPIPPPAAAPGVPPAAPPASPSPKQAAVSMPVASGAASGSTNTVESQANSKASRGFVYRAFMTLSDLENAAPKITQQLKELGAEKAGEVELGWRRGSGRYYHFSMPENNEQRLLETLRGYGPVRISKDPHPRVMPQGQVRFILWVESGI